MLAIVGGTLALLLGVLALLLPLLTTELSRPRDAFWGAVVLLLGLVLVTSADRLTGAPMLAVLCGGLLIGRLGTEVVQLRWRQLSPEEQQRLASSERWRTALSELATTLARLLSQGARRPPACDKPSRPNRKPPPSAGCGQSRLRLKRPRPPATAKAIQGTQALKRRPPWPPAWRGARTPTASLRSSR